MTVDLLQLYVFTTTTTTTTTDRKSALLVRRQLVSIFLVSPIRLNQPRLILDSPAKILISAKLVQMMTLKIMIRRRKTSRDRLTKRIKRIHDNEKRRDETKKKKETIQVLEINENRGENRRHRVELSKPWSSGRHRQH